MSRNLSQKWFDEHFSDFVAAYADKIVSVENTIGIDLDAALIWVGSKLGFKDLRALQTVFEYKIKGFSTARAVIEDVLILTFRAKVSAGIPRKAKYDDLTIGVFVSNPYKEGNLSNNYDARIIKDKKIGTSFTDVLTEGFVESFVNWMFLSWDNFHHDLKFQYRAINIERRVLMENDDYNVLCLMHDQRVLETDLFQGIHFHGEDAYDEDHLFVYFSDGVVRYYLHMAIEHFRYGQYRQAAEFWKINRDIIKTFKVDVADALKVDIE